MDISAVFSVLVIILGGISVLLLVSSKTLRDSRDDQEKRITQLEKERTEDRETIASQKTELAIWRRAVTGEAQLNAISKLLNQHHGDAVKNWLQVSTVLSHVGRTLDHMDEAIEDLVAELRGKS